jgi:hypothetical protein
VLYRLRQYPIPQGSWADETLGSFGAPVVAIFETNVFFVHGDAYWSAQGNARFVCVSLATPKNAVFIKYNDPYKRYSKKRYKHHEGALPPARLFSFYRNFIKGSRANSFLRL